MIYTAAIWHEAKEAHVNTLAVEQNGCLRTVLGGRSRRLSLHIFEIWRFGDFNPPPAKISGSSVQSPPAHPIPSPPIFSLYSRYVPLKKGVCSSYLWIITPNLSRSKVSFPLTLYPPPHPPRCFVNFPRTYTYHHQLSYLHACENSPSVL